jgi:hypothetical protein
MRLLELKAKVKSGKENELNQVITDLVPYFKSIPDLETDIHFNEDGVLNFKLSNSDNSKRLKEVMMNNNFVLFIGSIKVLCDNFTLNIPYNENK